MQTDLRYNSLLIGNFDQVWSLHYKPKKNVLAKSGAVFDELKKQKAARRMRHCLERCLDLPLTEPFGEMGKSTVQQLQGGMASNVPVEQWRLARTLCTLSWANGDMGRGYITVREDGLTEAQRIEANQARVLVHLE